MRTQSRDTRPEAERVLIDLLRKAPVSKRFALVRSMTASLAKANMRDIQRLHPRATQAEVARIFVSHIQFDGTQQLAESLEARLNNKQGWTLPNPDILIALNALAEIFEKHQIKYYIGGSLASSIYGMHQLVRDIDIVADLQPAQICTLTTELQSCYLVKEHTLQQAVQQHTLFNMLHLDTLLRVDVIIPNDSLFEQQALRRVQDYALDKDSRAFPLSSPEDLILVKLRHHSKAEIFPDDQWNDILGVLKVQGPNLDKAYIEQWATELGITHLLQQACLDAGL